METFGLRNVQVKVFPVLMVRPYLQLFLTKKLDEQTVLLKINKTIFGLQLLLKELVNMTAKPTLKIFLKHQT
ncbi:MAG: hypothetical protein FD155_2353 [Bacteroidetes bacterium]|nr:MAG: hypothetical protein FD155_2353 [Bacteroidota bacterium]